MEIRIERKCLLSADFSERVVSLVDVNEVMLDFLFLVTSGHNVWIPDGPIFWLSYSSFLFTYLKRVIVVPNIFLRYHLGHDFQHLQFLFVHFLS